MEEKKSSPVLIMAYTGDGKGKTSAAVGQAIRALGGGFRVAFGQFLKRDEQAGEQAFLKSLLGDDFFASGRGFFRGNKDQDKHRAGVLELIAWINPRIDDQYDLIVLDESIYALNMGLLKKEELEEIIEKSVRAGTSLVLTGRNIPRWLKDKSDMVSEIREIKHHFQRNIPARKGIEY